MKLPTFGINTKYNSHSWLRFVDKYIIVDPTICTFSAIWLKYIFNTYCCLHLINYDIHYVVGYNL